MTPTLISPPAVMHDTVVKLTPQGWTWKVVETDCATGVAHIVDSGVAPTLTEVRHSLKPYSSRPAKR